MSKIDRDFWNSPEGMTLAEVEATARGFHERWIEGHAKQDFERLGDCLIHRAGLLNDGFRLTDEEFERFRAVAEIRNDDRENRYDAPQRPSCLH